MKDALNHLRREKCPPAVLQEVRRRIRLESPAPAVFRIPRLAFGAAALLVVLAGLVLMLNGPKETFSPNGAVEPVAVNLPNPHEVAEDARLALASIGRALILAGRSSQAVISDHLVPSLDGGIETIHNKLTP